MYDPRNPTAEPSADSRTPGRLGALVMLAIPTLAVLSLAEPAFTAGVAATTLVVAARDRL